MFRKSGVLLLVFSIMISLVVSVHHESHAMNKDNNSLLTQKASYQVAKLFYNETLFVDAEEISFYSELYDVDDSILGYYYDLLNYGETVGYIIVSAKKDFPPILEFGEGIWDKSFELNVNKGLKTYYLNAFNIMAASNKDELNAIFEDQKNKKIKMFTQQLQMLEEQDSVYQELLDEVNRINQIELSSYNKSKLYNENYSYNNNSTQNSEKELPVVRLWQRMDGVNWPSSACGPAAAAMIVNYYKSLGYNVKDSNHYGSDSDLINKLWNDMAWWWGTSTSSFRSNTKDHLNENYNSDKFGAIVYAGGAPYSNLVSSIDMNEPFAIKFHTNDVKEVYTSYHWVVGVGYRINSNGNFIGVKDPDGGQYNTSRKWISYDVNKDYMSTVHIWANDN